MTESYREAVSSEYQDNVVCGRHYTVETKTRVHEEITRRLQDTLQTQ